MATLFPNAPMMRPITNDRWVLEEDFIVFHKGKCITVKRGFETDGGSVPRFCWRVMGHPFSMPILCCYIPHDGLYMSELVSRSEADWIFLELMKKAKVGWLKRNAVWSAVRIGGGIVWAKHKTDDVIKARELVSVRKVPKKN